MTPPDFFSLYQELSPGEADGRLPAIRIPNLGHRIARGEGRKGGPILLITVQRSDTPAPPPLVLEHLTLQHDVVCRVVAPDGSSEAASFSVATCTSPELGEHFLRVVGPVVELMGPEPTRNDASIAFRQLSELFRSLRSKPRTSAQALFAELFVMAASRDTNLLARAWHLHPEDRYDFSSNNERLEVKSTRGEERHHHFSLEQVRPEGDARVLIASLRVVPSADGLVLKDLLDSVRTVLSHDPELLLHVDRVVSDNLGDSLRHAIRQGFDQEVARGSLQFFHAHDVPAVELPLPRGVTNVRFLSDLSGIAPARPDQLPEGSGLLEAVVPVDPR